MKIYLPHIHYTIYVKEFKKAPDGTNFKAYAVKGEDGNSCTIYLPKKPQPGTVAHELTHALRYICVDRNMDFRSEEEHMAYIMNYAINRILGYSYLD